MNITLLNNSLNGYSHNIANVIYDKFIKVNYYCPDIVSKNRFNKKYLEKM